MESQVQFKELEEYALSHTRFSAPADTEDDFIEQYVNVLNKKGYHEGDFFFDDYMDYVYSAKQKVERFIKRCPLTFAVMALRQDIARRYMQHDKRDPECVIYTSDVVLMAVIWSSLCGNKDCKEHARFWFEHNPIMQYLIPSMPSPKWMISAETIRFFLKMIPDGEFSSMFRQYFGDIKIKAQELLENIRKSLDDELESTDIKYRHLIGGDGQELLSSFRRGESNRRKKGAHRVSFFDCDTRNVLNYTLVKYKNNEAQAFMAMLKDAHISSDDIFYADALNARGELIDFLNSRKLDWIFAVKTNLGNQTAVAGISNFLEKNPQGHEYFHYEFTKKESSRIETRKYDIIPVSAIDGCQLYCMHSNTRTLIRVSKVTQEHLRDDRKNSIQRKPTESVLYFISSLEYTEDNCRQIVHSLKTRWLFETQHNILDTVLLQDNQHCCDDNHLASIVGLNSMVLNVTTFSRELMSQRGYSNVKHRNAETAARAPLIPYKRVFSVFRQHPLVAMQYLCEYFSTPPVEE